MAEAVQDLQDTIGPTESGYNYQKVIQEENMNNFIDPKNPHTVGKSIANLGNHVLLAGFIGAIIFVVVASYG